MLNPLTPSPIMKAASTPGLFTSPVTVLAGFDRIVDPAPRPHHHKQYYYRFDLNLQVRFRGPILRAEEVHALDDPQALMLPIVY